MNEATQHILLQMHCYDSGVKLDETLRAYNDLVRSGKVRYVGLSNFTGSLLQKVMDYNHFMGFDAAVTLQVSSVLSSKVQRLQWRFLEIFSVKAGPGALLNGRSLKIFINDVNEYLI